jgi:hypothetical protein
MTTTAITTDPSPESLNADLPADLLNRFRDKFDPARVKPDAFRDPNDVVLFVHLPKTAGMSVGKSLRDAFDVFYGVAWEEVNKSFRQMTQRACYLRSHTPCRQVLMGHYGWNEVSMWADAGMPVKCATITRDPVARILSNYNYNTSDAHPNRDKFMDRHPTLDSFARSQPNDFQLTRMVGLFYSFEQALEKLIANYSFLGITESLPTSLDHFSRSHGLPDLKEHHVNVARRISERPEHDPAVIKLIRSKSHNDLRLHALLKTLFPPG